ncbi:unnamed protein product, partial [Ectocarpus sp. 13 AM-2016]
GSAGAEHAIRHTRVLEDTRVEVASRERCTGTRWTRCRFFYMSWMLGAMAVGGADGSIPAMLIPAAASAPSSATATAAFVRTAAACRVVGSCRRAAREVHVRSLTAVSEGKGRARGGRRRRRLKSAPAMRQSVLSDTSDARWSRRTSSSTSSSGGFPTGGRRQRALTTRPSSPRSLSADGLMMYSSAAPASANESDAMMSAD